MTTTSTQRIVEAKAITSSGATVFIRVPYEGGEADSRQRGYRDALTIARAALQAALYAAHETAEELDFMDTLDAEADQERQAARCAAEERDEEGQRFCCGHEPCQAPDLETPETKDGQDIFRFIEEQLEIGLYPWQRQWIAQAMKLQAPGTRTEAFRCSEGPKIPLPMHPPARPWATQAPDTQEAA